jgi:hypothetical protein
MGFSPAGPRGRRFRSDRLLESLSVSPMRLQQEVEKTMMPSARKCYIVLSAIAL